MEIFGARLDAFHGHAYQLTWFKGLRQADGHPIAECSTQHERQIYDADNICQAFALPFLAKGEEVFTCQIEWHDLLLGMGSAMEQRGDDRHLKQRTAQISPRSNRQSDFYAALRVFLFLTARQRAPSQS